MAIGWYTVRNAGILTISLFLSQLAWGACASPAGVEGEMVYTSNVVKYCDNTNWVDMDNANTGSSCAGSAGTIRYNATYVEFCSGATNTWWRTSPNQNQGTCVAGDAGKFYYESGGKVYWHCTGSAWRRMARGCSGTVIGPRCWYQTGANTSCDSYCTSRGGYDAATATVAGSTGSLAGCRMVAFAVTGATYAAAADHACSNAPIGCARTSTAVRRCIGAATTGAGANASYTRFCACRY